MGIFSRLKSLFCRREPLRLGLALGSGGAKGMAHLGVLKAFEEAGLSFSVIAGSSIGAIVGALYAKGFSSADMVGIVEGLNRREFSRNLRPFADMDFAERFLEQYLEGDFSALPLPFAACATDGETNSAVVLREGPVARALTASAAIPPFFRGVDLNGRRLYDGAFTDAVPADVCKEMGADFTVGVDLSAHARPEEEKSRISRLIGTAINAFVPVRYTEDCKSRGYASADFMLKPNLHDFHATDVSRAAMDAMFELGYSEAKGHMEEIFAAMKEAQRASRKRR